MDILEEAKKRFDICVETSKDNRAAMDDDMEAYDGRGLWPEEVRNAREQDDNPLPCYTYNLIPTQVKQVTNEQRKNKPQIKISPYSDGASKEVSEALEDIIRSIRNRSNAKVAYTTASDHQGIRGLGYIEVTTKYVDKSFDQEIIIKRVKNPNCIYFPECEELDYSDAPYAFKFKDYPRDEYEEKWPDADKCSWTDGSSNDWIKSDKIRVVEYFKIVKKQDTLYMCKCPQMLKDGSVVEIDKVLWEDEYDDLKKQYKDTGYTIEVLEERKEERKTVKWYLLSPTEILDEKDIIGEYIPIIPVIGEEIVINGETIYKGVVRNIKDAVITYNVERTAEVEINSNAPRVPYLGFVGQFESSKEKWDRPNANWPYIETDITYDQDGRPLPLPQRQIMGLQGNHQQSMRAKEDVKYISGIFNDRIGEQGQQRSGVAIRQMQTSSDTATYNFPDNLAVALEHLGRLLITWIPKVYDTRRILQLIGRDSKQYTAELNGGPNREGKFKGKIIDLTQGQFTCAVEIGPAIATKRQEDADRLIQLTGNFPVYLEGAADILIEALDIEKAEEISERVQYVLAQKYPDMFKVDQDKIPPAVRMQLKQAMMENQQLKQIMQQMQQELQSKNAEIQAKLQAEQIKAQAARERELIKSETSLRKEQMGGEYDIAERQMQELGETERKYITTTVDIQ